MNLPEKLDKVAWAERKRERFEAEAEALGLTPEEYEAGLREAEQTSEADGRSATYAALRLYFAIVHLHAEGDRVTDAQVDWAWDTIEEHCDVGLAWEQAQHDHLVMIGVHDG